MPDTPIDLDAIRARADRYADLSDIEDLKLILRADASARDVPALLAKVERLRMALELIGAGCENFTSGNCADLGTGRSPYAKYLAARWCDRCIARTALSGGEFPERGTSGVEEVDA